MESNQDQALMRGPPDHRANGPDIPLSGYAAGLVRLAVGLYVIRCAVSHHNHQGCITISNLFPFLLLTLRHRWSVYVATPFHPHLTYSIHRNSLDNHGTSQPLRWCRQSEPFIFIGPPSPIRETGQDHCHTGPWSREAVLSRHTSATLSMAAASASATALGICALPA